MNLKHNVEFLEMIDYFLKGYPITHDSWWQGKTTGYVWYVITDFIEQEVVSYTDYSKDYPEPFHEDESIFDISDLFTDHFIVDVSKDLGGKQK